MTAVAGEGRIHGPETFDNDFLELDDLAGIENHDARQGSPLDDDYGRRSTPPLPSTPDGSIEAVMARIGQRMQATTPNPRSATSHSRRPVPNPSSAYSRGRTTPGHQIEIAEDPYEIPRQFRPSASGATSSRRLQSERITPDMPEDEQIRRRIQAVRNHLEQKLENMEGGLESRLGAFDRQIDDATQRLRVLTGARSQWIEQFKAGYYQKKDEVKAEYAARVAKEKQKLAAVENIANEIVGSDNEYAEGLLQYQQAGNRRKFEERKAAIKRETEATWANFRQHAAAEKKETLYRLFDSEIGSLKARLASLTESREATVAETQAEIDTLRETDERKIATLEARLEEIKQAQMGLVQRALYRRRKNQADRRSSGTVSDNAPRGARQLHDAAVMPRENTGRSTEVSLVRPQSKKSRQRTPQQERAAYWTRRRALGWATVGLIAVGAGVSVEEFGGGSSNGTANYASSALKRLLPDINAAVHNPDIAIPIADTSGNTIDTLNVMDGSVRHNDPNDDQGHTYASVLEAIVMRFGGNPNDDGKDLPKSTDGSTFLPGVIPMNQQKAVETAKDMGIKNFNPSGHNDPKVDLEVAAGLFNTYSNQLLQDTNNKTRYDNDHDPTGINLQTDILKLWGFDPATIKQLVQISMDWQTGIGPSPMAQNLLTDKRMQQIYAAADMALQNSNS